jgi:hypothetical protein
MVVGEASSGVAELPAIGWGRALGCGEGVIEQAAEEGEVEEVAVGVAAVDGGGRPFGDDGAEEAGSW